MRLSLETKVRHVLSCSIVREKPYEIVDSILATDHNTVNALPKLRGFSLGNPVSSHREC